MPRIAWSQEEDIALIEGIREYGEKWRLIKQKFPWVTENHPSPTALKDRAKYWRVQGVYDGYISGTLLPEATTRERERGSGTESVRGVTPAAVILPQAKHEKVTATTEEPELEKTLSPEQNQQGQSAGTESSALGFRCECGHEHTWKTMLLKGLKCQCARDVRGMLKQVGEAFTWVVYILLQEKNGSLTDEVRYVGVSCRISNRVSCHNHEEIQKATFEEIRVSVLLGESQTIALLRPTLNVYRIGGTQFSNVCRIFQNGKTWTEICTDTPRGTQGYGHEYNVRQVQLSKGSHTIDDMETHIGLTFSHCSPRRSYEDFCFLKGQTVCSCDLPCWRRKLTNVLSGREIGFGVPKADIKETIFPYRQLVRYKGRGDKNAKWTVEFTALVLRRNEEVRETTMSNYQRENQRLWKLGIMEDFAAPWKLMRRIQQSGAANSHNNTVIMLRTLLSHMTNREIILLFGIQGLGLRQEYHHIGCNLKELSAQDGQSLSEQEKRNWISTKELRQAVDELDRNSSSLQEQQAALWYRMMLDIATVRNDYATLKIHSYDPNRDNYLDLIGKKIVLNTFKTSDKQGRVVLDIEASLLPAMSKLYTSRLQRGHQYLIARQDGGQYTSSGFSNAMNIPLRPYAKGKHVGSQLLRKIVITEEREGELSIAEKKRKAQSRLHSVSQSEKYRRIF